MRSFGFKIRGYFRRDKGYFGVFCKKGVKVVMGRLSIGKLYGISSKVEVGFIPF